MVSDANLTPTLEHSDKQKTSTGAAKRAKWHLGIRSQSKPHDIMHEVFRAMTSLNFEWKIINPFHVRVRRKNPVTGSFVSFQAGFTVWGLPTSMLLLISGSSALS